MDACDRVYLHCPTGKEFETINDMALVTILCWEVVANIEFELD
jgi:hypothetical protein